MVTTKRAKNSKGSPHRVPTDLLVGLLDLIRRIDPVGRPPEELVPVSWADRQTVALLLGQIANDKDPRDYYWRTVAHRPKASSGKQFVVAFLYLAAVEMGQQSNKVLRGRIAELSGMTESQVEHAVRDHKYEVKKFIETAQAKDSTTLQTLVTMYEELAEQREK